MHQFVLKIIVISLTLLINTTSLSMEIVFDMQKFSLSEDIYRNIFVVASPSIKNQLKICSKSWHAIGAKKTPNMYRLLENESLHLRYDDWRYMMMHAALDENVVLMKNILDPTDRNRYYYLFGLNSFGAYYDEQRSPKLYDPLDLRLNSFFMACFIGDIDKVRDECNKQCLNKISMDIKLDCLHMAIYNDNPYCIQELSHLVNHWQSYQDHLNLLFMAMRNQKKRAFKALVECGTFYFGGQKDQKLNYNGVTTTLDEICKQKDIPNLDEYIALYRELGGKTLLELGYDEHKNYTDFSPFDNCSVQ